MKQIIYVSSGNSVGTINVRLLKTMRDLVAVLDLEDRFALPEFFHLVRKPLPLLTPVVLVKNLLLAFLIVHVSLSFIQKMLLWNWSLSSFHFM